MSNNPAMRTATFHFDTSGMPYVEPRQEPVGYSFAFVNAFEYAAKLHQRQVRKGNGRNTPYITHLMAVAALVAEYGGDEEQVIAALLHDAVEDQGGQDTLDYIGSCWGERVARMVRDCSDTFVKPKPPWRVRKEEYIAHAATAPLDSQLVSLADKTHNARCTLADLRQFGSGVWNNFRGGFDGMMWYWSALGNIYKRSGVSPALAREFEWTLDTLLNITDVLMSEKQARINARVNAARAAEAAEAAR